MKEMQDSAVRLSNVELTRLSQRILSTRVPERDHKRWIPVFKVLIERALNGLFEPISMKELAEACFQDLTSDEANVLTGVRGSVGTIRRRLEEYFLKRPKEPVAIYIPRNSYVLKLKANVQTPQPGNKIQLRRSNVLGLLLARRDNWFNSELIAGADLACRESGFRLVVACSDGSFVQEAEQVTALSKQCAGLMMVPILDAQGEEENQRAEAAFSDLLKDAYPTVFVDRRAPKCDGIPLIGCDNTLGGALAAEYLQSQQCTHFLIASESGSTAARERVDGFRQYLHSNGIDKSISIISASEEEEEGGYGLVERLFLMGPKRAILESSINKIGVFATNDALLRGMLVRFADTHLNPTKAQMVPIGFDGRDFGAFMVPPIASIHQDFYSIGTSAVTVLKDLVARPRKTKKAKADLRSISGTLGVKTPVQLLVRGSGFPADPRKISVIPHN
jgi:DNA-binding LacI/PurR family transcriptional regulator